MKIGNEKGDWGNYVIIGAILWLPLCLLGGVVAGTIIVIVVFGGLAFISYRRYQTRIGNISPRQAKAIEQARQTFESQQEQYYKKRWDMYNALSDEEKGEKKEYIRKVIIGMERLIEMHSMIGLYSLKAAPPEIKKAVERETMKRHELFKVYEENKIMSPELRYDQDLAEILGVEDGDETEAELKKHLLFETRKYYMLDNKEYKTRDDAQKIIQSAYESAFGCPHFDVKSRIDLRYTISHYPIRLVYKDGDPEKILQYVHNKDILLKEGALTSRAVMSVAQTEQNVSRGSQNI